MVGDQEQFAIRGLALATINLCYLSTKFEVTNSTHYKATKGDKNIDNRVVWGS